jgi:adenosine deaminase
VQVHAGEWPNTLHNVQHALTCDAVRRIGHGVCIAQDAGVTAAVRTAGVTVECCPGANVGSRRVASFAAHPVTRLRAAGLSVALGSDNLLLSGDAHVHCSPTHEVLRALSPSHLAMGVDDVRAMCGDAAAAAFGVASSTQWRAAYMAAVDAALLQSQSQPLP